MKDDQVKCLEWGLALRPLANQAVSGDTYLISPSPAGALVAVIDGLGHGEPAAQAGALAVDILKRNTHESLPSLFKICHEELRKTRGVVMTLVSFDIGHRTMSWLGVGNVEGVLLGARGEGNTVRESLLLRGGVVGYQLPSLRVSFLPVMEGDLLALATDGIRGAFSEALCLGESPQQNADRILAEFGKDTDDALILVLRFRDKGLEGC